MFPRDGSTHDYLVRMIHDSDYSKTGLDVEIQAHGYEWIQWGQDFLTTGYGIEIHSQNVASPADSSGYTLTVTIPGDSFTYTDPAWKDSVLVEVTIDDADLSISADCNDWEFNCGDIKVYVDSNLEHTFSGPFSWSGTDYSEILNNLAARPDKGIIYSVPFYIPNCYQTEEDIPDDYSLSVQSGIRTGYKRDTTEYVVVFDCDLDPPDVANVCSEELCECTQPLPPLSKTGGDCPTSTWDVAGSVLLQLDFTDSVSDHYRACTPCLGGNEQYHKHTITFAHQQTYEHWAIFEDDQGIPYTRRTQYGYCTCDPEILDPTTIEDDTVEADTHSESYRAVFNSEQTLECYYRVSPACLCAYPDTPDEPAPVDTNVLCLYFGSAEVSHPVEPPCNPTGEDPCIIHDHLGQYYFAYISDGDVYYKMSRWPAPIFGWAVEKKVTSSGDCSSPTLCILERSRIELMYARDSLGVYYRWSDDDGKTWRSEVQWMADVTRPRNASHKVDGNICRAAFEYLSGTSGPGKIIAVFQCAGEDASDPFYFKDSAGDDIELEDLGYDISQAPSGQDLWLLTGIKNGATTQTHWFSTDDCRTWREVTL